MKLTLPAEPTNNVLKLRSRDELKPVTKMSNTVVKDITPAPNAGDNSLVIVVGEDGSLSVDPETLHSLISKYFEVFSNFLHRIRRVYSHTYNAWENIVRCYILQIREAQIQQM